MRPSNVSGSHGGNGSTASRMPAPILAVVHFLWRVKKDVSEPMTYAAVLATVLLIRVVVSLRSRLA